MDADGKILDLRGNRGDFGYLGKLGNWGELGELGEAGGATRKGEQLLGGIVESGICRRLGRGGLIIWKKGFV